MHDGATLSGRNHPHKPEKLHVQREKRESRLAGQTLAGKRKTKDSPRVASPRETRSYTAAARNKRPERIRIKHHVVVGAHGPGRGKE